VSFQTSSNLFNIIIYIQSHINGGLEGKFYRLELGKPVMERPSVTIACLLLLLFWVVQLRELTSMAI